MEKPLILILGPGGIKGLLILGFLKYTENINFLSEVNTICGVSVGALIGILLILDYTINQIIDTAINLNLFVDFENIKITDIFENNGLLNNDSIKQLLLNLFLKKNLNNPNFLQLYQFTNKEFVCVSYNINQEKTVYFSHKNTPNNLVIESVLASMNIPLIYQKYVIDGEIYIDGALGNSYPVDYFLDRNQKILGIYIYTSSKVTVIDRQKYLHRIIQSSMIENRNRIIKMSPNHYHICLKSEIIDSTGITINLKNKSKMLAEGFNIAINFFEQK